MRQCGAEIRVALDNSLSSLRKTLDEIVNLPIAELDSEKSQNLVAKAKSEYEQYQKIERKIVDSFFYDIITNKLIEGPRGSSRLEHEPFEKTFVIEYDIFIPDERKRRKKKKRDVHEHREVPITIDKRLERSMKRTTDTRFTLNQIVRNEGFKSLRQMENQGVVLDIHKSYTSIKPNYAGKFKRSDNFKIEAIDEVQIRYKRSSSLAEKLFDMMYGIDKIDLDQYRSPSERKNKAYDELPDKLAKLETKIPYIGDRVGTRIITQDELNILRIGRELAKLSKPPQYLEEYYTGNPLFNDDRIREDLDGIVQAKPYLEIVNPEWVKPNGYQSLHINYRHCNVILEVQVRTREMHEHAESGEAEHREFKVLEGLRRQDFISKNPHTAYILETLKHVLRGIE